MLIFIWSWKGKIISLRWERFMKDSWRIKPSGFTSMKQAFGRCWFFRVIAQGRWKKWWMRLKLLPFYKDSDYISDNNNRICAIVEGLVSLWLILSTSMRITLTISYTEWWGQKLTSLCPTSKRKQVKLILLVNSQPSKLVLPSKTWCCSK